MSLFRDAVDKRADEAISTKPSIQSGYMMDTSTFISELRQEPLFKTFNSMSELDLRRVEKDIIETGISVGVKDTSGVSRKEVIHCNPKVTNLTIVGGDTGKIPVSNNANGFSQIDLIFSGTNNQIPTINGIQQISRNISDKTQTTAADTSANTSVQGAQTGQGVTPGAIVEKGGFSGQKVPEGWGQGSPDEVIPVDVDPTLVGGTDTAVTNNQFGFGVQTERAKGMDAPITFPREGSSSTKNVVKDRSAVPKLIDNKGKASDTKDTTQTGVYGQSVRTGALKVGNYDLASMVKMSTPAVDAILGGRPNR